MRRTAPITSLLVPLALRSGAAALALMQIGCATDHPATIAGAPTVNQTATQNMKIELLGFPGCPNTPAMRANLVAALAATGNKWTFTEINQQELPASDIRAGYPTPTILVNGSDLYGMPTPEKPDPACRMYPGGVPDSDDIAAKLGQRARAL